MLIAMCRSFTASRKGMIYSIRRHGKALRDGGQGILWTCNCADYHFRMIGYVEKYVVTHDAKPSYSVVARDVRPCKHLTAFWACLREGFTPNWALLTPAGERYVQRQQQQRKQA